MIERWLRLPVVRPVPENVDLSAPVRVIETETALFYLQLFNDPGGTDFGERFGVYEHHNAQRCHGCGCPPFSLTAELPPEVVEHLEIHLQVCLEFWPAKAQES